MTQKLITEVTYTGDGNNLKYAIPFEYLARSHIHLYIDGTETTNFVWIDTYRIELTTAPATGTAVTIKRRKLPLLHADTLTHKERSRPT